MSNFQGLKERPKRPTLRPTERRLAGMHGGAVTYEFGPGGMRTTFLRANESKTVTLEPHNALRLAADIRREYGGME